MIRSAIPNLLTASNLLCGVIAVVQVLHFNNLVLASYLIFASLLFDLLDGAVARLLKVDGELGKQLDSLADMVSFGLLPGVMLFKLGMENSEGIEFWNYFAFLVPVFAALRLAKFNIDTRQTYYFIGLPTPAATAFVVSFPLVLFIDGFEAAGILFYNPIFLAVIAIFLSAMMVAPIPLLSLKASKGKKPSKLIWVIGGLGILSFSFFHFLALPIVILLYLFLSLLFFKPHEVQS